jgi:(1->4)-alpha-D-glucan 1-alpha-D-glucosylmutase
VTTRLPVGLAQAGGWGDTSIVTSARPWIDVITGRRHDGGTLALADVLDRYPVALLVAERAIDDELRPVTEPGGGR